MKPGSIWGLYDPAGLNVYFCTWLWWWGGLTRDHCCAAPATARQAAVPITVVVCLLLLLLPLLPAHEFCATTCYYSGPRLVLILFVILPCTITGCNCYTSAAAVSFAEIPGLPFMDIVTVPHVVHGTDSLLADSSPKMPVLSPLRVRSPKKTIWDPIWRL